MKKQREVFFAGNEMAAISAAHIDYHYMGYFPISPSTEIAQYLDMMAVRGESNVQLVPADGEHSSAGMMFGAAVTGARVFNATSSNGLAFMLEQLPVVAATRYPAVMNLVTRAISAPLNIHCDHSDLYLTLNIGWIILNSADPQAVYDQNILALKVAERINLPAIVTSDAYITSHQKHNVKIFADPQAVRDFVGKKELKKNKYVSDLANPITIGAHDLQSDFMNNKYQLQAALESSLEIYREEAAKYFEISGRQYSPIETYQMEDAEVAIFILNSAGEIAKGAVDKLRSEGKKVGIIRPNIIRPFPLEDILEALKGVDKLIIAERADTPGSDSSYLSSDINTGILNSDLNVKTETLIYGLGGKEVFPEDFEIIFNRVLTEGLTKHKNYYGVSKGDLGEQVIDRQINYNPEDFKVGGFDYKYNEESNHLDVKIPSLRNLMKKPKRITGGHSACPGCGIFPGVEQFLRGIEGDVIMVNQTGCAYVVTANYPTSAHKGHYIHNLFQNGASTLSGIVDGIMEMKNRKEILFDDDATFVMLTGDGGMDIGLGPALGAGLRNHKMIILEYDNEGYMNTGAQQSYSTPIGHRTSTSNVGKVSVGKKTDHKNTPQIMAATNIPYVFTGADAFPQDLIKKGAKAHWYAKHYGMVYGQILIACPLNWKSEDKDGSNVLEAAVNSNFYPLYEIEQGITNITYNPEEIGAKVETEEWLKYMGKSRHLLKADNKEILDHLKETIDLRWKKLKAKDQHPDL